MNRAAMFTVRPCSRLCSTVNVYLPSGVATLPTPKSVMPTFAPESGCPAAEVTRPVNVTVCADATLAIVDATTNATGTRNNRWSHEPCMTDLASREKWITELAALRRHDVRILQRAPTQPMHDHCTT